MLTISVASLFFHLSPAPRQLPNLSLSSPFGRLGVQGLDSQGGRQRDVHHFGRQFPRTARRTGAVDGFVPGDGGVDGFQA